MTPNWAKTIRHEKYPTYMAYAVLNMMSPKLSSVLLYIKPFFQIHVVHMLGFSPVHCLFRISKSHKTEQYRNPQKEFCEDIEDKNLEVWKIGERFVGGDTILNFFVQW